MIMKGAANLPTALINAVEHRVMSAYGNLAGGDRPNKPLYSIDAAIPLYRYTFANRNEESFAMSAVRSGRRLFISNLAQVVMCVDVVTTDKGYSCGLIPGPLGSRWLESIRRVTKRRSVRPKLLEARILLAPAIHAEYLWLRRTSEDTFLVFDGEKGIAMRQRQERHLALQMHARDILRGRVEKQRRMKSSFSEQSKRGS